MHCHLSHIKIERCPGKPLIGNLVKGKTQWAIVAIAVAIRPDANRVQAQRGRVQLETKSENDRAVLSLELRNQNQGEALKLMQNLDDKCIICEL